MGSVDFQAPVGLLAHVDNLKGDVLPLTIAIQPKNEPIGPSCLLSQSKLDVLGVLSTQRDRQPNAHAQMQQHGAKFVPGEQT